MLRWAGRVVMALAILGGGLASVAGADAEPDIYRTTLPNGLRAIVRERPGSEVVAISVGVRGGSRDERAETVGAAHFMEHMFFQGTPRRPDLGGHRARARGARRLEECLDRLGVDELPGGRPR